MSINFVILSSAIFIASVNTPHNFTIIDFWQKKCDEGDTQACGKIEDNKIAEVKLAKLNKLADIFRDNIRAEEFLLEEKPNLGKAYPLVINEYLTSLDDDLSAQGDKNAIEYCAKHFHNYWINKKFWWPTDARDEPDWGTIYVYIVDHYHGVCLNQPF
ncbi:MAG: hypothetical protein GKR93_03025 [Gammaproteobacteria bacterium]|nr:hypothetical protein [Gammaproteobacteria bacterium]